MTCLDWTPSIQARAAVPERWGSAISAPLRGQEEGLALAKALEAAPAARMPLDVGRRTKDAVHASSTTFFAKRFANATDEVDVERSAKSCRAREAGSCSAIRPLISAMSTVKRQAGTHKLYHAHRSTYWLSVCHTLIVELTGPSLHYMISCSPSKTLGRKGLTRTLGTPSRFTGAVCHMSSPLKSAIFSSLDSCFSTATGSMEVGAGPAGVGAGAKAFSTFWIPLAIRLLMMLGGAVSSE